MDAARRISAQVAAETAVALLLAALFAGAWSFAKEVGFLSALSTTAYLAAGIWLFAGSTLFPKLTIVEHSPWSGEADEATVIADPGHRRDGVALSPIASSIIVAALLVGVGFALG